jgi:hypothetical protein
MKQSLRLQRGKAKDNVASRSLMLVAADASVAFSQSLFADDR